MTFMTAMKTSLSAHSIAYLDYSTPSLEDSSLSLDKVMD